MTASPPRAPDERGQTSLLIIGLAIVAAMMVAVVTDASAAYLQRQGLDSLADGAALAAADGVQGEQVYTSGLGKHAAIDPRAARGYVADYLREMGAVGSYPGLGYSVSTTEDSVVVELRAGLDLPLAVPGQDDTAVITGRAASVVVVGE